MRIFQLFTIRFAVVVGLCLFSCCQVGCAGKGQMQVKLDGDTGQYLIVDGETPVVQYNYASVEPGKEYLEKVHANNRKYAAARSNYIHPLYGPEGEKITYDWSSDHPHHRGIYWAWPEVQYQGKMYDLHALQNVFARPTGKVKTKNGKKFAQIEAENRWMWDDKDAIVLETATIRAWAGGENGRYIDLTYKFEPLVEGVTLARRGTKAYGGLNIRMTPIKDMKLVNHADDAKEKVQAAWQAATGTWKDGTKSAVFAVFEKAENPEYPGDYIEYPNLPWYQPTFPKAGNRFELKKDEPLVLKYRLWIRSGDAPSEEEYRKEWKKYQDTK